MQARTLAILSVSAGAGHVRAAEALKATAEKRYPGLKVVHVDVMELVSDLFRRAYAGTYMKMATRNPALWGYLYRTTELQPEDSPINQLRAAIERLNTTKLSTTLEEIEPDAVICTHFLPAQLLSRKIRKGTFDRPVWVQITDFDVHSFWIREQMTGYFVAAEEMVLRLRDGGIDPSIVHVTGIPVMPAFGEKLSRTACAADLGVDPAKTTLALMAGAVGTASVQSFAERLLGIEGDFQIIALAGKNAELLKSLQVLAAARPGRLFPFGFTTTIERMMAVSDVAITKSGGLTTSECLAMGLPMIVISPIPGQEERNADYLLENGAAMKAMDAAGLEYRVRMLLREPARLYSMRKRAEALGKPHAARDVIEIVLGA